MQKKLLSISVAVLLLIGCRGLNFIPGPSPTLAIDPTQTASPLLPPTDTAAVAPTASLADTPTATPSETPTFTSTPAPTIEPQRYRQGPGEVIVPILLYHHIAVSRSENIYYVSPYAFEQQMNLLRAWGYTTISVELMVRAIREGSELPPKPVIITFDDESPFTMPTTPVILPRSVSAMKHCRAIKTCSIYTASL